MLLRDARRRGEDNIRMDLKGKEWETAKFIYLVQYRDHW
jgi:hypothetical protein